MEERCIAEAQQHGTTGDMDGGVDAVMDWMRNLRRFW